MGFLQTATIGHPTQFLGGLSLRGAPGALHLSGRLPLGRPLRAQAAAKPPDGGEAPQVTLFTKAGCTLCDKALEVLEGSSQPFQLQRVDIEAKGNEEWNQRYWCDIPVFHINGAFWAKHRLDPTDVEATLEEAAAGDFAAREGEPDMRGTPAPEVEICGDDCCGGPCTGNCREVPAAATALSAARGLGTSTPRGAGIFVRGGLSVAAAALLVRRRRGARDHKQRAPRAAEESEGPLDFFSGEQFSRRALLTFESEKPLAQILLSVTLLVTFSGLIGLVYNVAGQVALLTTPGAKPGLDTAQGLLIQVLSTGLGGAGFLALQRGRTATLRKLDSELAFGALELQTADGLRIKRKLSEVKGKQRVLAVFGEGEALQTALRQAAAYRRRWASSRVLVIAVGGSPPKGTAGKWLAEAVNPGLWSRCRKRFGEVTEAADQEQEVSWLLFGLSGRIRGSGLVSDFDQVLAFVGVKDDLSKNPPRATEAEQGLEDESTAREEVLKVHDAFYEALKDGDAPAMAPLWMAPEAVETEASLKRRVPWESVLSERAAVLAVVDADVVFTQEGLGEATVTSIEVCKGEASLFNEGGPGGKGTLLATKVLRQDSGGSWRLVSHQTIPYCPNTVAYQSLRCNANGCTLLKRDA